MKFFPSIVRTKKDLVFVLSHAPKPESALAERLEWIHDLIVWITSKSPLQVNEISFKETQTKAIRLKWLVYRVLGNPEWKKSFIEIFQSVAAETQIFELLVSTGLQRQSGVISEIVDRIIMKMVPREYDSDNLEQFFSSAFSSEEDAETVSVMDRESFDKLIQLLLEEKEQFFEKWKSDFQEAIAFIAMNLATQGTDVVIRRYLKKNKLQSNSFYQLNRSVQSWLDENDADYALAKKHQVQQLIQMASRQIAEIYTKMDESGVSIGMVFRLEKMEALLKRLQVLIDVQSSGGVSAIDIQKLLKALIFATIRSHSVRAVISENTALIAKKITENSAEAGEHYIARSASQYFLMLKSSLGGGCVTALTTILKFIISGGPFSPLVSGVLASLNYSTSFLLIQSRHFTLATKQPAMTAAAVAQQLRVNPDDIQMRKLTDEILNLIRSQVIAVIGNVSAVVPCILIFCFLFQFGFENPFLDEVKSKRVMEDFSILGPTPFYAAWTGVLLFASSLIAGWFYHWALFNRVPQAMARHPKLVAVLGPARTRLWASSFKKNCAGIAGNISLGFFLGLVPVVATFIGLPLDVRHVTLSSGSLAAAIYSLGHEALQSPAFLLAVAGVISMAFLNLLVSFSLALAVAIRAKQLPAKEVMSILRYILRRILFNPLLLLLPPAKVNEN